jgi:hypothetical protein
MKPVRWIERLPLNLKKDSIHNQLINKYTFEFYMREQLWALEEEEASLYYYEGSYIDWCTSEVIINHGKKMIGYIVEDQISRVC